MLCRATQDGPVVVESSDKTWSTGEGNGKPLQHSCLENPMNSKENSKGKKNPCDPTWTVAFIHVCLLYPGSLTQSSIIKRANTTNQLSEGPRLSAMLWENRLQAWNLKRELTDYKTRDMRGILANQGPKTLKHQNCRLSFLPITLGKAFFVSSGESGSRRRWPYHR